MTHIMPEVSNLISSVKNGEVIAEPMIQMENYDLMLIYTIYMKRANIQPLLVPWDTSNILESESAYKTGGLTSVEGSFFASHTD